MSKSKQPTSNKDVAKRVITPKRLYFVPGIGAIEATDLSEVEAELKKKEKQNGNK